ncbi:Fmp42 protein [Saccharomycopsis crataegensis]|uniref:Fmp42 protein n=1 Tax=Saccharomycopsis crataegensis TaxID=43959 RepID=A0AAV5QNK8_9ASCO|nr:Fmp42 protein [Saccharomycopsis crataegensis]
MFHFQEGSTKRAFQVFSAIFWCLFAAGPMFGFAALKPFLIKENVYEGLCFDDSGNSSATSLIFSAFMEKVTFDTKSVIAPKCPEQDLKLNFIFTVCAVVTNICALPIGYLLDNYGPKLCGLVGSIFIFIGTIIIVNSRSIISFDPFLTGFAFVALGGPFTFISSFHLSNAFPKNSGLILALLTGAFDASSSVFLIYSFLNSYLSSESYNFSIASFFKLYIAIPLFIFLVQIFLMPKESYQADVSGTAAVSEEAPNAVEAIQHEINENSALLPNKPANRRRSSLSSITRVPITREEVEEETVTSGGIFGILHGQSLKQQFSSNWFWIIAIFTTVQMLRLNYFISTVNSQYTYLFGSHEEATKLNKIFDIALPLGGLVSIPFVGYILDTHSTLFVVSALSFLSVFLGVLGFIPKVFYIGVLNVLLFVAYRPFFYTTISDVAGKVFGFETFGIIYGTIMSISGIVNFGQSYFDKLTHTVFKMNPGPINYILVSVTFVVSGITVSYINQATNGYGKQHVQKVLEEEHAREQAIV